MKLDDSELCPNLICSKRIRECNFDLILSF
jgi:hypothetical protein